MEKEEIIEAIKEFFNSKNAEFNVTQPKETANDTLLVGIKFKEPIELTEQEYDELRDFLKRLHFSPIDTWENNVIHSYGYRSYTGIDEYQNNDNDDVRLYYTKVCTRGKATYFIDKIWVEENTQEYMNELY